MIKLTLVLKYKLTLVYMIDIHFVEPKESDILTSMDLNSERKRWDSSHRSYFRKPEAGIKELWNSRLNTEAVQ